MFNIIYVWTQIVSLDVGDSDLLALIEHNATAHFRSDSGCPLEWEPSGYDFLSPCLQVEMAAPFSRLLNNQHFWNLSGGRSDGKGDHGHRGEGGLRAVAARLPAATL